MPLIIFDSTGPALSQNMFDSEAIAPRPRILRTGLRPSGGQGITLSSEGLPPMPAAGAGTIVDSAALPPAPPVPSPGDALIVINEYLQGTNVEGPLNPPAVPAPNPVPAGTLGLTGGPDGDLSVVNPAPTPNGKGYSFFIQSPENPGEVPALPPPAPPFGPVDP